MVTMTSAGIQASCFNKGEFLHFNISAFLFGSKITSVTALTQTLVVNSGDKIRCMIQVEDVDLKLDAFVAFGTTPNDVPVTPSCILNIHRIGD